MKLIFYLLLLWGFNSFCQTPGSFKGEHYALYNKCKMAVTFCEITQQDYLSCGSVKNCYGLYVLPGDTFYINIEDKTQSESISADVSFGGYFPAITAFTFQPVDFNCIPQQALQIVIPLTATIGSSFQVIAQNVAYVNPQAFIPGTPEPFNIFVGGQQPLYTFALADFTNCPLIEEVGIEELEAIQYLPLLYPNPTNDYLYILGGNYKKYDLEIYNELGSLILKDAITNFIDLSRLCNGIYSCKIIYDEKILKTEKVILIH